METFKMAAMFQTQSKETSSHLLPAAVFRFFLLFSVSERNACPETFDSLYLCLKSTVCGKKKLPEVKLCLLQTAEQNTMEKVLQKNPDKLDMMMDEMKQILVPMAQK